MKKLLVLALVAMVSATAFSKTIDEVFNSFPKADNVQEMTLDENMLKMAMSMGADQSGALKDVNGLRLISIEEPSDEQISIAKKLMNDGVDGFEEMVNSSEDGQDALILTQGDGDVINKMLIFAVEKESVAIVLMEGKIDPNNANKLVNFGK
ncbi:MAG: DUF4252 domain-containing protein [Muribaculaceae bacterium]|nr:DUF4252 domain-containing protein [Muribaculaceae bacterium]